MPKFIFTRHCTTSWNLEKRMQGQKDLPLHEKGMEEAHILARAIYDATHGDIDYIISSDLLRAKETARILNQYINIPDSRIIFDSRLRECSFGSIEGHTREEAEKKFGPKLAEIGWNNQHTEYNFKMFGGENDKEVLARHMSIINDIPTLCPNAEKIMLVGHGRGLSTLLYGLNQPYDLKQREFKIIEI